MATEPITSGSLALSAQPVTDVTAEVQEFLTAERPDTEFLPSSARMSRAELDALPTSDLDPLGIGVIAGAANVIMQLSLPAVGYGVYESRVDSGNLFKHPMKRGRTTLSYLAVAGLGSAKDRKAYRKAIGKAHAQVRSTADSPVKYNAFDPKLQLWVAACLYRGTEDVHRIFGGVTEVTDETISEAEVAMIQRLHHRHSQITRLFEQIKAGVEQALQAGQEQQDGDGR